MEYITLLIIGLIAGLFGGIIGIGGAIIMIPALVFAFGENQHLYQASSMIGAFCTSAAALVAHKKANIFVPSVLKYLIPSVIIGMIIGVTLSNSKLFFGSRSYLLARIFGFFLLYVAGVNLFRLIKKYKLAKKNEDPISTGNVEKTYSIPLSLLSGLLTGLLSGLLGIGGGSVSTLFQQLFLKMPLKSAMSNSAVMIVLTVWIGALYKNLTLTNHGINLTESFKISAFIIPTALVGGFIGGHLMHILPKNIVRFIFIAVILASAVKMLTVEAGMH